MTQDFLEQLVENASMLISSSYYETHSEVLKIGPSLKGAIISSTDFPIIAEVKLSSPSLGDLCRRCPEDLADQYIGAGAAALSVLTEPNYFKGNISYLRSIAWRGVPVLMKDIVISNEQIDAAAELGASAVLLIQSIFTKQLVKEDRDDLLRRAHSHGLEVVLEAANAEELSDASRSRADILGINQRNLADLSLDREKGIRILSSFTERDRPIVIMSGIESRQDIMRLRDGGADAVLVGTSLSRAKHPGRALSAMAVPR